MNKRLKRLCPRCNKSFIPDGKFCKICLGCHKTRGNQKVYKSLIT